MVPNGQGEVPAIELRDLAKVYLDPHDSTEVMALDHINVAIRPGEFVSLIGPSGCGKTTLLKIVDGLIPYESGEVLIDGKSVTAPGRSAQSCFSPLLFCRGGQSRITSPLGSNCAESGRWMPSKPSTSLSAWLA